MPKFAGNQHDATRAVVEAISALHLKRSIYAAAVMYPENSTQGPFELLVAPRPHGLLASAGTAESRKSDLGYSSLAIPLDIDCIPFILSV